jgi:hypothetical protein
MTPAEVAEVGDDAGAAVEANPETSRVMLRKSAWDGEHFAFDTVFAQASSQEGAYTRSTFQLNLSALYGMGATPRGCVARVEGVLEGV